MQAIASITKPMLGREHKWLFCLACLRAWALQK